MSRLGAALALALALGAGPAAAQAPCFVPSGEGVVEGGDGFASLRLSDGREVRLADIVPADALGIAAPADDALATAAPVVVLRAADAPDPDRYGRIVGDIVPKDTARSELTRRLRAGLALVHPAVMSDACLNGLFAAEREAEDNRRGLWADGSVVRRADDPALEADAGRFALVSGVVRSVGETRQTLYLNFGTRYSTDFTVLVRRQDAKDWADTLIGLEGQSVRVRGVLEAWNGGMIRLRHPRQIEVVAGRAVR